MSVLGTWLGDGNIGCSAESGWALASRARLARLMGDTLVLSAHGTRRGDGSIGLQCGGQLAAGLSWRLAPLS